jgi:hypothetical protein
MIRALIAIAINRDIQGDPAYIRCARCGTVSDMPVRTLSTTTWRPGRPPEHHHPARVDLPLLRA